MTTQTIKARLQRIEESRAKATQGDWHEVDGERILVSLDVLPFGASGLLAEVFDPASPSDTYQTKLTNANTEFIALAANEMPWLLQLAKDAVVMAEKISEDFGTDYADGNVMLAYDFLAKIGEGMK